MTQQLTIGEVDWETADLPGDRNENRESDFLVLEEGDNKGRVLSQPQQFYVHWVVDETGKKRKVNCATEGCPVCARGQDKDKRQVRWLVKFFSRKLGKVKLIEISTQIFKGVKTLVNDPDWGLATEYDINIKRGPEGAQPLYTVIPSRRVPLTTEEKQALVAFNERVDISKFIAPPTPAVVAEKLGWTATVNKTVSNNFHSSTQAVPKVASQKQPSIDFDFDSQ